MHVTCRFLSSYFAAAGITSGIFFIGISFGISCSGSTSITSVRARLLSSTGSSRFLFGRRMTRSSSDLGDLGVVLVVTEDVDVFVDAHFLEAHGSERVEGGVLWDAVEGEWLGKGLVRDVDAEHVRLVRIGFSCVWYGMSLSPKQPSYFSPLFYSPPPSSPPPFFKTSKLPEDVAPRCSVSVGDEIYGWSSEMW